MRAKIETPPNLPYAPEAMNMLSHMMLVHPCVGMARLLNGGTTIAMDFFVRRCLSAGQWRDFEKEVSQAYELYGMLGSARPRSLKIFRLDKKDLSLDPSLYTFKMGARVPKDVNYEQSDDFSHKSPVYYDNRLDNCDIDRRVLEKAQVHSFNEFWDVLMGAMECIVIERDVATFSREEITFLIDVLRRSFGPHLVVDNLVTLDEDQQQVEIDNFNLGLATLRSYVQFNHPRVGEVLPDVIAYRDGVHVVVTPAVSE